MQLQKWSLLIFKKMSFQAGFQALACVENDKIINVQETNKNIWDLMVFGNQRSSDDLLLCSTEETKSHKV